MAERLDPKPRSNVSNEVIAAGGMELDRAQRDIDEATGRKRAILKRLSGSGIKTKPLLAALALRKKDEDSALSDMRDMLRYVHIVAPGIDMSQASLFDDLDVRPLGSATQSEVDCWNAHLAGYEAATEGTGLDDANYEAGSDAQARFHEGYDRGARIAADKMEPNAKQADASRTKKRGRGKPEHDVDLEDAVEAGSA